MTNINLNTREQARVYAMMNQSTIVFNEDDCDAELSFDDLTAVNGGFWLFKATKTAAAVTGWFPLKVLDKYYDAIKPELNPKTAKIKPRINKTGWNLWDKLWTADWAPLVVVLLDDMQSPILVVGSSARAIAWTVDLETLLIYF